MANGLGFLGDLEFSLCLDLTGQILNNSFLDCYRPPFEVIEVWLETLRLHLAVGAAIPHDLLSDIYTYTGEIALPFQWIE